MIGLQCPFCGSEGWTDELDRLVHVLDQHSAQLFIASAILREFRAAEGLTWDTYAEWLAGVRAQTPGLGR